MQTTRNLLYQYLLALRWRYIIFFNVIFCCCRLRNDKNGGAWCPRQMVSRHAKEYLEINLEELYVITGARTQGRFGNGQGQEYAEEYMMEYWRTGFNSWTRWKDRDGKEVNNPICG